MEDILSLLVWVIIIISFIVKSVNNDKKQNTSRPAVKNNQKGKIYSHSVSPEYNAQKEVELDKNEEQTDYLYRKDYDQTDKNNIEEHDKKNEVLRQNVNLDKVNNLKKETVEKSKKDMDYIKKNEIGNKIITEKDFNSENIIKGFVLKEILDSPRSKKRYRRQNWI